MPRGTSSNNVRGLNRNHRIRPTQGTFNLDWPVPLSAATNGDQADPIPPIVTSLTMIGVTDTQSKPTEPFASRPPYFEVGTEVLYNAPGYKRYDEHEGLRAGSWRKWRSYIVRRNDNLTNEGNWMYNIAEIGGSTVALAAEEHLFEITHPVGTKVEFIRPWIHCKEHGKLGHGCGAEERKAKGSWIVIACRVEQQAGGCSVVYDVENEHQKGLLGTKMGVKVTELAPYSGPRPTEDGEWLP